MKTKSIKNSLKAKTISAHPDALAKRADEMPWKTTARYFKVEDYIDAICKLRTRDYSYAEIAKWLTEQLAGQLEGKSIRRGQVYRVFQQWIQDQREQEDISLGVPPGPKRIFSEEEAEVEAEISDKKPLKPIRDKTP